MKSVYNYHFKKSTNRERDTYILEEGGANTITISGGTWTFDGQVFKKEKQRWSHKPEPTIMIIIK